MEVPKFDLGQVVATQGALDAFAQAGDDPSRYLVRHVEGDWGNLDAHDIAVNNDALKNGGRLLSAYELRDSTRIWIITEWDRSATTILLPDEY